MGQRTAGDLLFERYLAELGIPIPEHEADLGIGKMIDYAVVIDGHTCLCEVKEFAPTTQSKIPGSMQDMLKPVRDKIHAAAPQLKAARGLGYPLVVVLPEPAPRSRSNGRTGDPVGNRGRPSRWLVLEIERTTNTHR